MSLLSFPNSMLSELVPIILAPYGWWRVYRQIIICAGSDVESVIINTSKLLCSR